MDLTFIVLGVALCVYILLMFVLWFIMRRHSNNRTIARNNYVPMQAVNPPMPAPAARPGDNVVRSTGQV